MTIGNSSKTLRPTKPLRVEALEPRRLLTFDPSGFEQALLESINRIRLDPQSELDVLFTQTSPELRARDPQVQAALDFFDVSSGLLLAQWSQLDAAGPLAWNEDLYDAAEKHNIAMQAADEQTHQVDGEPKLGDRIEAEGYDYRRVNENVYAFAEHHIHAHAGFVVDWGDEIGGIQDPAGHRDAIMDRRLTEVGIHVLHETDSRTSVGPYLVTQDFAQPQNPGQPFVLGVVYTDANQNGIYDPGEGHGGVTVTVSGPNGSFTTDTMSAGGYQVRVPRGVYSVSFSGPMGTETNSSVVVGAGHEKVDFVVQQNQVPVVADIEYSSAVSLRLPRVFIPLSEHVSDADGSIDWSTLEFTHPEIGSVIAGDDTLVYTPPDGFEGRVTFQYRVADDSGAFSDFGEIAINVRQAPRAEAMNDVFAFVGDVDEELHVLQNDIDAGAILGVTSEPVGEVTNFQGSLRYRSAPGFRGVDEFSYEISSLSIPDDPASEATVRVFVVDEEAPWQNPDQAADVDGNGIVAATDVIQVINRIGTALAQSSPLMPFVDTNGNGTVEPADAIVAINELVRQQESGGAAAPLAIAFELPEIEQRGVAHAHIDAIFAQ